MEQITIPLKSPTSDVIVTANYNKLSDHIRRLTPQGIQCSVFCGGTNCKYENPENWTPDSLAIQGIYSHWVTDHILAMARPSTIIIIQRNMIQQFESLGIKSIINLQCPKEHASCGQPLENSGFSYDPNIFMENNIYYYNFAWKDYGDATLIGLLNMVKVVAFAVSEGRVAIHCHAGLGRTGVLIACFLVYSLRVQANAAIKYVRLRRPGSVQTRGQIVCVRHFAQYILPNLVTYYIKDYTNKDKFMLEFTLARFLKRQKIALHGYEERNYKYIPKILHKLCERILKLCGCWCDDFPPSNIPYTSEFLCAKIGVSVQRHESIYSICSNLEDLSLLSPTSIHSPSSSGSDVISVSSAPPSPNPSENSDLLDTFSEMDEETHEEMLLENKCFQELEFQKNFDIDKPTEDAIEIQDIADVINTLITTDYSAFDIDMKKTVRTLQSEINASQIGWHKLDVTNDVTVLSALVFDWFETLKKPILGRDNLEIIVVNYKSIEACFSKLEMETGYIIEYILIFLGKLHISEEMHTQLMKRFISALCHQHVIINDNVIPAGRGFRKLRDGTYTCLTEFMSNLYALVDVHHREKVTRFDYCETFNEDDNSDVESGFH